MEPIAIYAIITGASILTGILIGVLIGWLSAKSKFGSKIASLQAQFDNENALLTEHKKTYDDLLIQQEGIEQQLDETVEAKKKVEWKLAEQAEWLQHLQQEKELANTKAEDLTAQLTQTKESYATIKAQHDELYKNHIQLNNEKSRSKDEMEKLRQHENDTAKKLATETTKYNELIKSADDLATNIEKMQREYMLQLTTNNELTAQNHSLRAKYAEAQKAIIQQREFIGEAQKGMKDVFSLLAEKAIQNNSQQFLELANTWLAKSTTTEAYLTIPAAKASRKKVAKELAPENPKEADSAENELF